MYYKIVTTLHFKSSVFLRYIILFLLIKIACFNCGIYFALRYSSFLKVKLKGWLPDFFMMPSAGDYPDAFPVRVLLLVFKVYHFSAGACDYEED